MPKVFDIPIDYWLRGPLRDWAENLLSIENLEDGGYQVAGPIRKACDEHANFGSQARAVETRMLELVEQA